MIDCRRDLSLLNLSFGFDQWSIKSQLNKIDRRIVTFDHGNHWPHDLIIDCPSLVVCIPQPYRELNASL